MRPAAQSSVGGLVSPYLYPALSMAHAPVHAPAARRPPAQLCALVHPQREGLVAVGAHVELGGGQVAGKGDEHVVALQVLLRGGGRRSFGHGTAGGCTMACAEEEDEKVEALQVRYTCRCQGLGLGCGQARGSTMACAEERLSKRRNGGVACIASGATRQLRSSGRRTLLHPRQLRSSGRRTLLHPRRHADPPERC